MGHVANLRAAGRRDKVVDDPLLNRCGIQVARTVAARARHAIGRRRPPADADARGEFRDGDAFGRSDRCLGSALLGR